MPIRFGHFDPLGLSLNILDKLMRKGLISGDEARDIIRKSLPPEMLEAEKERIINSMITPINPNQPS